MAITFWWEGGGYFANPFLRSLVGKRSVQSKAVGDRLFLVKSNNKNPPRKPKPFRCPIDLMPDRNRQPSTKSLSHDPSVLGGAEIREKEDPKPGKTQ